jgi:hypothetical protein
VSAYAWPGRPARLGKQTRWRAQIDASRPECMEESLEKSGEPVHTGEQESEMFRAPILPRPTRPPQFFPDSNRPAPMPLDPPGLKMYGQTPESDINHDPSPVLDHYPLVELPAVKAPYRQSRYAPRRGGQGHPNPTRRGSIAQSRLPPVFQRNTPFRSVPSSA